MKALKSIELLGDKPGQYKKVTSWEQTKNSFDISLPAQPNQTFAYVLKLKFDKMIPVPQPKRGAAVFAAKSASGHGVTLGLGSFNKVFLAEAGLEPKDIRFIRVSSGTKLTLYSKGDLSGNGKQLKVGEHSVKKGSVGSIAISKA
ncbi:hypothetical protein ACHAP5_011497 [Fusarium lateritium]